MSSVLSVREVTRKRIIDDMVRAAQPQGKWRIMVVDSNSLKTLNAVCKMYDILEQNITRAWSFFSESLFFLASSMSVDKEHGVTPARIK